MCVLEFVVIPEPIKRYTTEMVRDLEPSWSSARCLRFPTPYVLAIYRIVFTFCYSFL